MDALPAVVLANAAAAGLLCAAAGLVAAVGRSPAVAHKAWLLVLLKLVTPPLIVLPVAWAAAPAENEPRGLPPREEPPAPGPSGDDPDALTEEAEEDVFGGPGDDPAAADGTAGTSPAARPEAAPHEEAIPPPPFPWRTALIVGWAAGAGAYWLVVVVRVVQFRRALRHAAPAGADDLAAVRRVADRLGLRSVPAVLFVEAAVSPMVWAGFGRPRLVLPRPLWDALPADQREAVLAHELAHLRRRDHWVRRLEVVALGLYWWFPAAWLACRRLRDAEEACCDAWVVWALPGRAAAYAAALVETVAFVSRPGWVPLASGGAARAAALKRRLTMILSNDPAPRPRRAAAAGLLAAALLALPVRPGLADGAKPPADPPPPAGPADVFVWDDVLRPPPAKPAAEPAPAARPRPAAPAAEVATLRDELELLAAQGQTKAAQVRAAEVAVKAAERKYAPLARLRATGQVAESEVAAAESELENARAQVEVRRAELNEHEVKVRQAKRRLDAAQGTDPMAGPPRDPFVRRGADKAAPPRPPAEVAEVADRLAKVRDQANTIDAHRQAVAEQLKALDAQRERLRAELATLDAAMKDLLKKHPDAARPSKP